MQTQKQKIGEWGEKLAATWLLGQGYLIVERNYNSPPGEIDIIARIGDALSFIEVKTRTYHRGSAERAVGFVKQSHLMRAAKYYCRQWNVDLIHTSIRFEQISVYCSKKDQKVTISKYILPVGMDVHVYQKRRK